MIKATYMVLGEEAFSRVILLWPIQYPAKESWQKPFFQDIQNRLDDTSDRQKLPNDQQPRSSKKKHLSMSPRKILKVEPTSSKIFFQDPSIPQGDHDEYSGNLRLLSR